MRSDWQLVKVVDIAASHAAAMATGPFGSSISAKYFTECGVPVIRGSNLSADVSTRLFDEGFVFVSTGKAKEFHRSLARRGDLVFTCWGTINQVGLIDESTRFDEYIVSNKQMKVTLDRSRADPRYIYYVFSGPDKQAEILENGIGSSVPGFNLGQLKAHQLFLPPLAEQEAIAGLLKQFDDRIDLLRQTNATLESIAQALFKSWFIDFDPVRAKVEGHEPGSMDAATAALFPDAFQESAMGPIPKGWRPGTLADAADLNARSWTAKRAPPVIAYVDLAGVKSNVFDTIQRFMFGDAPSRARRELRAGDTLVGTVRPGNRSFGFISEAEAGLTGSTGFAVLSPREPEATTFTYLCATRDESIERLAALADGAAYPAVRPEIVAATPCVLPSKAALTKFASITEPLMRSISANALRARTLANTRDTLLPRLISGKLRLPEAQVQLEDTLA